MGSYLMLPNAGTKLLSGEQNLQLHAFNESGEHTGVIPCTLDALTEEDRQILAFGCLIHYDKGV